MTNEFRGKRKYAHFYWSAFYFSCLSSPFPLLRCVYLFPPNLPAFFPRFRSGFSHYLPYSSSALLPYSFPFILRMFCLYLFASLHFLYFLHSIFIVILPLTSFKILLYNWKLLEYFRVPPRALNAVDLQETHPVMKEGSISNCVSRRLLC